MNKSLIHHAKHHLVGKFISFIAALWASGLVSAFFEKKSSKNLWGISGDKAAISSDTYQAIESSISIIIGFAALLFVDYLIETGKHIVFLNFIKSKAPFVQAEIQKFIAKTNTVIKARLKKHKQ